MCWDSSWIARRHMSGLPEAASLQIRRICGFARTGKGGYNKEDPKHYATLLLTAVADARVFRDCIATRVKKNNVLQHEVSGRHGAKVGGHVHFMLRMVRRTSENLRGPAQKSPGTQNPGTPEPGTRNPGTPHTPHPNPWHERTPGPCGVSSSFPVPMTPPPFALLSKHVIHMLYYMSAANLAGQIADTRLLRHSDR